MPPWGSKLLLPPAVIRSFPIFVTTVLDSPSSPLSRHSATPRCIAVTSGCVTSEDNRGRRMPSFPLVCQIDLLCPPPLANGRLWVDLMQAKYYFPHVRERHSTRLLKAVSARDTSPPRAPAVHFLPWKRVPRRNPPAEFLPQFSNLRHSAQSFNSSGRVCLSGFPPTAVPSPTFFFGPRTVAPVAIPANPWYSSPTTTRGPSRSFFDAFGLRQ